MPFGVDMIVRPGETADKRRFDAKVAARPICDSEEYGAEHYGFEYGEGFVSSDGRAYDDEVHPAEEEEEMEDEEQLTPTRTTRKIGNQTPAWRRYNARSTLSAIKSHPYPRRTMNTTRRRTSNVSTTRMMFVVASTTMSSRDRHGRRRRRRQRRGAATDGRVERRHPTIEIRRERLNVETDPKARGYVRVPPTTSMPGARSGDSRDG